MQVIICDVCHRGVDPSSDRVYGTLNIQSTMGLGAQTIDAHMGCYQRLMSLLVDEAKAELPRIWHEGDPNGVTAPVDPGTAVPPPTGPDPTAGATTEPAPAPDPTAGATSTEVSPAPDPSAGTEPAPQPDPSAGATTTEPAAPEPSPTDEPQVQTDG